MRVTLAARQFLALTTLLCALLPLSGALAAEAMTTKARNAIIIDGETGAVLFRTRTSRFRRPPSPS
jgi:D-alanyl-D-alanine carboxypeptidase